MAPSAPVRSLRRQLLLLVLLPIATMAVLLGMMGAVRQEVRAAVESGFASEDGLHDIGRTHARLLAFEHCLEAQLHDYSYVAGSACEASDPAEPLREVSPAFEPLIDRLQTSVRRLLASSAEGDWAGAHHVFVDDTSARIEEVSEELMRRRLLLEDAAGARRAEVAALLEKQRLLARWTNLLGLISLMVPALWAARRIHRAAGVLMGGVASFGRGDLKTRIRLDSNDELGVLAHALNSMAAELDQSRTLLQQDAEKLRRTNADLEATTARMQKAQEELVRAERLAAIGAVTAGVAHDINNPLTYVTTNLHYLADELAVMGGARAKELHAAAEEALDGTERIRTIVSDLRLLSRSDRQGDPPAPVDLRRVLDACATMAQHEIRGRAKLERDYAEIPPVLASNHRLGQVFLNLIVNAAHAIGDGGADRNRIILRTRLDAANEDAVVVEVEDTGSGIPDKVRARLFEPFFTTKPAGLGTGLGLAISRRIVESMGGTIALETQEGRGSTFRVRLPVATPPDASEAPEPASAAS